MATLKYIQTNGKLENSSIYTYAFNLPAVATCPGAGVCKEYCFALGEQKRYPSAMAYRQRSLVLSKSPEFVAQITHEIQKLQKLHGTQFAIRIHASGDFYSPKYIRDWTIIIRLFPDISFYAYTKSIALFKKMFTHGLVLPSNMVLIYSLGSTADQLVDVTIDRHAKIFQTEEQALDAGYTLANEDDAQAWNQPNNKIGLVIFGATRKFAAIQKQVA